MPENNGNDNQQSVLRAVAIWLTILSTISLMAGFIKWVGDALLSGEQQRIQFVVLACLLILGLLYVIVIALSPTQPKKQQYNEFKFSSFALLFVLLICNAIFFALFSIPMLVAGLVSSGISALIALPWGWRFADDQTIPQRYTGIWKLVIVPLLLSAAVNFLVYFFIVIIINIGKQG